jgi:hypothetical protein
MNDKLSVDEIKLRTIISNVVIFFCNRDELPAKILRFDEIFLIFLVDSAIATDSLGEVISKLIVVYRGLFFLEISDHEINDVSRTLVDYFDHHST